MADPKDSPSKAAIPIELLKVEAAFVKRAVTSSSSKRSKGQGAPSYKRDVMYAASKYHLNDIFIHRFGSHRCRLLWHITRKGREILRHLVAKDQSISI